MSRLRIFLLLTLLMFIIIVLGCVIWALAIHYGFHRNESLLLSPMIYQQFNA